MPEIDKGLIREGERLDDLQRNGLVILQHPNRFCFGMDAVFLSGFVKIKAGANCLDLGTGTGILPLLLSAKTKASHLVGLEIQPGSADMAARSVALNGLTDRIDIRQGDIKCATELFGKGSFDAVTCNPPYMAAGTGLANPEDAMAIARHEILCSFEDVAREASGVLKEGGQFFLVHRPFRMTELLLTLVRYRLEPKRIRYVYPFADREPNMVLIACQKGGGRNLIHEKPLIVFDAPGVYTKEVQEDFGF